MMPTQTTIGDRDLAAMAIGEFGEQWNTTTDDVLGGPGCAVVERFPRGFAVVTYGEEYGVFLNLLYVYPEHRGRRLGRTYMRQLLRKHGQDWLMELQCHKSLRPFYGSFGFRVVERNDDWRSMQMKEA